MIEGRWLLPGDQNALALNEYFAEKYPQVRPGDQITLRIAGKDTVWTVVGFFQFAGKNIGLIAFTQYDSLARATHTSEKAMDFRLVSTASGLSLSQQEELALRVETSLTAMGYKVREARAGEALRARTTGGLDALTNFLLFLAMLMAVVGSIGLTGTMSLNVLERTREIGVMRAIGARDGEVFA
ncbi:MAG TPA: ABC transporter permease, partial [Anaerolinea sp.]|nr:ABC transporter permease [Anaerolinea sp.]